MRVPADPHYRSDIPPGAIEEIAQRNEAGQLERTRYVLDGRTVGTRHWDGGRLTAEYPLRDGRTHGVHYAWYSGPLTFAEPYVDGVPHGTARQWDDDGILIGTYEMTHGTGVDRWFGRNEAGVVHLAEVRFMRAGRRHGFEWWLNEDEASVYIESHFSDGRAHGIHREWNARGRLRRGFPRYAVQGVRMTRRRYLRCSRDDPSLPPFREADQAPQRTFPSELLRSSVPAKATSSAAGDERGPEDP